MKKHQSGFTTRAMVVAVHGALLAMAAMPMAYAEEDPAVAELTQPAKTVEVGVRNVSKGSFKAGEYNGLQENGVTAIVNIDARGGGSYDSEDATRWRVTGDELGLETRNVSAEYSQQGKFKINVGYDELLRNRSDSYQTPYQGAGSGNVLTLPSTWLRPQFNGSTTSNFQDSFSQAKINSQVLIQGVLQPAGAAVVSGTTINTAAQQAANVAASNAALAADLPLFHNVDLSTKRTKTDVGFGYNIDSQWAVMGSFRREDKDGYKPMSTVSRQNAEIATTIADKIDTTTDQYNLSLGYTDETKFLKAAYYGSIFKNNVTSMTWSDWSSANPNGQPLTMSSAPDNEYHQFSLTGGYNFDKNTKLVLDGSYARSTQNAQFITGGLGVTELGMGVPATSANALVVTKAFNAKLTAKPIKDWSFAANYKYDDRDNRTPVNNYAFGEVGQTVGGAVPATGSALWNTAMLGWTPAAGFVDAAGNITSAANIEANRPYSKTVNQLNLDATYAYTKGQAIKFGYDYQQIDRSCTGTWIDCVDADKTKENTLRADWRGKLSEDLNAKVGYARSERKVDNYNENAFLALVPMAQYAPAGATTNANAGGLSLYQTMQAFGITGMGLNTGYLTAAQLTAMFPTATATQIKALNYYFGSAASSNGTGPAANALYASGNRISELIGMRRFNMADRDRDAVKASLDLQATEQLSLQGGLKYLNDDYSNSVYGLTGAKTWGLNLDATYAASENLSIGAFYSYEDRDSKMANDAFGTNNNGTGNNATVSVGGVATGATAVSGGCYTTVSDKNLNAKTDPCLKWGADMHDKVDTLGLSLKQKNLMAGKLDLTGGLTYSRATTDTNVTGGSYLQNPLLTASTGQGTSTAFYYLPATALPTVTTDTVELRLNGKYKIDKASAVHLGYTYLHMKNVDYAYDGMQTATVVGSTMPTNETAPVYTVHIVGASYIHNF
jgi:hypothetical protein